MPAAVLIDRIVGEAIFAKPVAQKLAAVEITGVFIAHIHHLQTKLPCDFVGMHPGSAINNLLTRAAAELEMPLRLRIQVTSYDALCLMVSAGLGVAVLPRGSAQIYRGTLALRAITLDEPWAQRRLSLCVRSEESLSSVARLLVDHLRAGAQEAP